MTQYVLNNIPLNRLAAVQTSARTVRTRPMGPLPRGRGPTLNRRMRTHSIGVSVEIFFSKLEGLSIFVVNALK